MNGYVSGAKRVRVLAKFGGCCALCGKRPQQLTVDHILPLSHGGTNDEGNLQPACRECNLNKGNLRPDELVGRWKRLGPREWMLNDHVGSTRLRITKKGMWRVFPADAANRGAALTAQDLIDAGTIVRLRATLLAAA